MPAPDKGFTKVPFKPDYLMPVTPSVKYEYDAVGNRTQMTTPAGTTTYAYDRNDRMTQAGETKYSYDAAGRMTARTVGEEVVKYGYDGFGRLNKVGFADDTGVAYQYDAFGRKTERAETLWVEKMPNGNAWGVYKDPGDKPAPAADNQNAAQSNGKSGENGNGKTEPVCPEGTVPAKGRSEKGNNGKQGEKPLKKDVQTTRYLYEGLGRNVVKEYGRGGQPQAQYYRGNGDVIARKQFGLKGLDGSHTMPMAGGLKYYLTDPRGSVSALTDPHGEVVEQYRYDAFGGLFTGATAPYNTTALNGHEFDPTAGLVDMKARWYVPQNGRFLTPDSWFGSMEEPWTQNRYASVGNNPLTQWDPTGNFPCTLGDADCEYNYGQNQTNWYFLQKYSPSSYTETIATWEDIDGRYREFRDVLQETWDYLVFYITWTDRSKGQGEFDIGAETYYRTTTTTATAFSPHDKRSLKLYTEEYRKTVAGARPGEVIIKSQDYVNQLVKANGGEWMPVPEWDHPGTRILKEELDRIMNPPKKSGWDKTLSVLGHIGTGLFGVLEVGAGAVGGAATCVETIGVGCVVGWAVMVDGSARASAGFMDAWYEATDQTDKVGKNNVIKNAFEAASPKYGGLIYEGVGIVLNMANAYATGQQLAKQASTLPWNSAAARALPGSKPAANNTPVRPALAPGEFNIAPHISQPSPRSPLQSHHILQNEWAKANLPKYDPDAAPTILLMKGNARHSIINTAQDARKAARVSQGLGKWSSTLEQEMAFAESDLRAAGIPEDIIQKALSEVLKYIKTLPGM